MSDSPTTPETNAVIEVRDMDFSYGKSVALRDINLTIPRNQVTAFIGAFGVSEPRSPSSRLPSDFSRVSPSTAAISSPRR